MTESCKLKFATEKDAEGSYEDGDILAQLETERVAK